MPSFPALRWRSDFLPVGNGCRTVSFSPRPAQILISQRRLARAEAPIGQSVFRGFLRPADEFCSNQQPLASTCRLSRSRLALTEMSFRRTLRHAFGRVMPSGPYLISGCCVNHHHVNDQRFVASGRLVVLTLRVCAVSPSRYMYSADGCRLRYVCCALQWVYDGQVCGTAGTAGQSDYGAIE